MNYAQAIKAYAGTKVDVDYFPKAQPYQCYDWAVKFMQRVYGLKYNPLMAWSGGVKDFYYHFHDIARANQRLDQLFDLVKVGRGHSRPMPKRGDIIIWSGNLPGSFGYGHVGVVDSATRRDFVSYDQNYGSYYVARKEHDYKHVLGWLTPKRGVAKKPASRPRYYVVRSGDYLGKIAARFSTTVTQLLRLNPKVRDRNFIFPRQRLRIR
jgi:LysM domain/CHAP domain